MVVKHVTKLFPAAVSSSVAARYWYCSEESYQKAVNGIRFISKKAAKGGYVGHEWLEKRPKSKSWLNVWQRLQNLAKTSNKIWFDRLGLGLGACRYYKGTKIIAHPDDYLVHWRPRNISLVENKTIMNPKWMRYLGPVARQQLLICAWVYEPIFEQISFHIDAEHFVQYWKRNGMWLLNSESVEYDPHNVTEFLDDLFCLYHGDCVPIPPASFKCESCKGKQYCRIQNGM